MGCYTHPTTWMINCAATGKSERPRDVFGYPQQPMLGWVLANNGLRQAANLSYSSRRNETAIYNRIALVTNGSKPWSWLRKTGVLIFASICIKVHTVQRISARNCRPTWFLQRCKYQSFNNIRNLLAMIRIPSLAPFAHLRQTATNPAIQGVSATIIIRKSQRG